MISLKDISKTYQSNSGLVTALQGTNLGIEQGQHVAIVGKSGSGKTTLLNIISGIDRPTSGDVIIDDVQLNNLKEKELALWRGRNVGIVFQFYQLIPTLSAFDNVLFAMNLVNKIPKNQRKLKAYQHLEAVGLADKIKKFPNELSGGQRQRVAIARSLANDPKLIIADEPTGNLDSKTGKQIDELFDQVNDAGTTIITVTHSNTLDKHYDRVLHIEDGKIYQSESTQVQLL